MMQQNDLKTNVLKIFFLIDEIYCKIKQYVYRSELTYLIWPW